MREAEPRANEGRRSEGPGKGGRERERERHGR
jgi:hypothetical protein